jgi:hypothetical protein
MVKLPISKKENEQLRPGTPGTRTHPYQSPAKNNKSANNMEHLPVTPRAGEDDSLSVNTEETIAESIDIWPSPAGIELVIGGF